MFDETKYSNLLLMYGWPLQTNSRGKKLNRYFSYAKMIPCKSVYLKALLNVSLTPTYEVKNVGIFNSKLRHWFLIGLRITVDGKVCKNALNFSEPVKAR